ncbi:MAG: glutamate-1-semialdehyde 2,1-aminomutase [Anaerolineales bacterium]|jgi:glutamate-1-semialdehyde 2,1-aminomutase
MKIQQSQHYYEQACKILPGGVDSPVRAFKAVGGAPLFIDHGEGPYLFDVDGNRYIDYVLSWGPLVLGHAHASVVERLQDTLTKGTSFGAPSPLETALAEKIQSFVPSMEMLRFVNSGTEATMSALRLARAFTGRHKIVKFEGCYHGHADMLLVQAGSGVATLNLPDSPGVPPSTVSDTLVAPYNDLDTVKDIFRIYPDQIAAVIIEPVAGNMGVVPPNDGFLQGLRSLTRQERSLLIFDEVMTGFRVHPGGAQGLYQIEPDLTTLGKVIGGGLPVGAYGGRRVIMEHVAPAGSVYQAGTLSGNPLAMAAGLATLEGLSDPTVWPLLENAAQKLADGLRQAAEEARKQVYVTQVGTMFSMFFTSQSVCDWNTVKQSNTHYYAKYFQEMLARGVYLAPSQFESAFISTEHNDDVIAKTLDAAYNALTCLD